MKKVPIHIILIIDRLSHVIAKSGGFMTRKKFKDLDLSNAFSFAPLIPLGKGFIGTHLKNAVRKMDSPLVMELRKYF